MSTDTYIDFHSNESWILESDWKVWSAFLNTMTYLEQEKHYDPCRVGYVFNFSMDCNFDDFHEMQDKLYGAIVDDELISNLVKRWTVMYDRAQSPPSAGCNDNQFCRWDLMSPVELKEMLEEHRGYHIRFRVD